jgi:hypothetical protein
VKQPVMTLTVVVLALTLICRITSAQAPPPFDVKCHAGRHGCV